ncbi:enoyl-CoA hydratase-related protein [Nonomuraea jabiensis]|uniref:enoyl-CoA hydratase-related protein n=1 Tax=Nonomuraea jabiensis TaxID=882448 RepID=UPI003447DD92
MTRTTAAGTVYSDLRDEVAWITISYPARRNALTTGMMAHLAETLRLREDDPAVRVIVLRGEGTAAFAAGADISEFDAQQTTPEAQRLADTAVTSLFGTLGMLTTPVIAMIHGHCIGAGLAIALAADIRIAADDSRFAIPAARLGIGYPVPLTQALVQAVGPGHAADILFTGRRLSAREALGTGLISHVVPSTELETHTRTVAATIAANAPLSVRAAKTAIRATSDAGLKTTAEELVAACRHSRDAREGQHAFLEKRAPRFTGR